MSSIAIAWRCIDRPLAVRVMVRRKSNAGWKLSCSIGRGSLSSRVGRARLRTACRADIVERQRARDHVGNRRDVGLGGAGAAQQRGQAVAVAHRRGEGQMRPVGRFAQQADEVVRRHALAGIGAPGERRDGLRAGIVPCVPGERGGRFADDRMRDAGRRRPGRAQQGGTGRGTTEPVARADRAPRSGVQSMLSMAWRNAVDPGRVWIEDQFGRARSGCRPPGRTESLRKYTTRKPSPEHLRRSTPGAGRSLCKRVVKVNLKRIEKAHPCGEPCSARDRRMQWPGMV